MTQLFATLAARDTSARLWQTDAKSMLGQLQDASADLIVTSPPYFVGKEYDASSSLADFEAELASVLPEMIRTLRPGGNLCLQVGNHVHQGVLTPLDAIVIGLLRNDAALSLRNRIIWTFGHGTHSNARFSGRHETILWYSKGKSSYFDLDAVRVPQRYPGKRHYKGPRKGDWSGNPLGKNPGDVWEIGEVWDIPNVKANHIEKTIHPCQFPVALVRRLVTALSPVGGLVVDPYLGSGTTAIGAMVEGRNFAGGDLERRYLDVAQERVNALGSGTEKIREDAPTKMPSPGASVATRPPHFKNA